jgi:hypothetical protein
MRTDKPGNLSWGSRLASFKQLDNNTPVRDCTVPVQKWLSKQHPLARERTVGYPETTRGITPYETDRANYFLFSQAMMSGF